MQGENVFLFTFGESGSGKTTSIFQDDVFIIKKE